MKLLFVSNLYPPNAIGGYERLCYEVADAFAGKNHHVSVLTSSYGGKVEDFPGQTVDRSLTLLATEGNIYQPFECPTQQLAEFNERNIRLLKQKLAAEQPDVVFVWNLYFFDRTLMQAIQESGHRVVFLLTDNWLVSVLNTAFLGHYFAECVFGEESQPKRLARAVMRMLARLGNRTCPLRGSAIFASEFIKDLHADAGIRFDDSRIIYHGVNLERREGSEYADRASLRDPNELRLLFAGRIVDVKGVHTAIDALPLVIDRLPELRVKLTVVGDARDERYSARLNALLQDNGVSAHVEFLPSISESRLFELFQEHDIYLFPSLYEPFSLTLIHALDAGIPTISSDAGGNKEIVFHRNTGMLFPKGNASKLADAVVELARDPQLRVALSRSARKTAQNYTFERMVDQIETYLEQKP